MTELTISPKEQSRIFLTKDKFLKRKIAEYEQAREELSKVLYRGYRDSTGYAWQSGILLKTTKKGGTYS